jgi:hypothetical protein
MAKPDNAPIDPFAHLRDQAGRWEETDLTRSPKERMAKKRRIKTGRVQCNWDLPASASDAVSELARRFKCPQSSVVMFLLHAGLMSSSAAQFGDALDVSRSLAFEYVLAEPDFLRAQERFLGASANAKAGGGRP